MGIMKTLIVGICLLVASPAWAAPTVTVNGSSGPIAVAPGSTLAVSLSGGPGESMDWIGLYETGSKDRTYLEYWYLNGTKTSGGSLASATLPVVLPKTPGTYEVRFFHFKHRKFVKLASSPVITVAPATAMAPATPSIVPTTPAPAVVPTPPAPVVTAPAVVPTPPAPVVMAPAVVPAPPAPVVAAPAVVPAPPAPVVTAPAVVPAPRAPVVAAPAVATALPGMACPVNPSSVKSGNWSDPAVWQGGCLPAQSHHVTIAVGHTITYDKAAFSVTEILVYGTLAFSQTMTTQLDVGSMIVLTGGTLQMGTAAVPMPSNLTATIRLQDIPGAIYTHIHGQPGLQPVLHAHGGAIELHGSGPTTTWTRLASNAGVGSSVLTVIDDLTGWKAGDHVVVTGTVKPADNPVCPAPPCHGDPASLQSEERVVSAVNIAARTLTLTAPLTFAHGGVAPSAACRSCRQAAVGNLTRNVVIRSATPAGRRGHVHLATDVTNSTSGNQPTVHIDNAAFVSLGRPEAGVYGGPHLHMLGNAKDAYVKRSAIYDSQNVWVRVHATNFATVQDNVGYLNLGNGFSTEDASEVYNVFDHNLGVLASQAKVTTNPNDPFDGGEGAAFWANNPRNSWTRNFAADSNWGFQIQLGDRGLSTGDPSKVLSIVDAAGVPAPVNIRLLPVLLFDGNTATGNLDSGLDFTGGRSAQVSVFDHFVSIDNKASNFATRSFNVVFDHLYAAHGGQGELAQRLFHLNDNRFYLGQLNATIRNSYVSALQVDYQMVGWVLLDHVQFDYFLRSGEGPSENVISILGPTAATGGVPYGINLFHTPLMAPDTTANMEVVLWDYDGPGQHVMLHQLGTATADTLTYAPSTRFAHTSDGSRHRAWQEARFTGPYGQGPTFAWPLRIDVGNRPDFKTPGTDFTRTDMIKDGIRWRVDARYVPSPSGTRLARYGFSGILPVQLTPGDDFTTVTRYDPSVLRSHRTGQQFRYTVDAPNGEYWVDLGWLETYDDIPAWVGTYRGPGTRVMDVDAQGVTRVSGLDVFVEAGLNTPLWKSFAVTVTNERLWLDFKQRLGYDATVSAIAVCPKSMVVGGRCP